MAATEPLTRDQFISLLMVGDARPDSYAPYIPIADETLLVRLGYVERLEGRLTLTAPGRARITSVEANTEDTNSDQASSTVKPRPIYTGL